MGLFSKAGQQLGIADAKLIRDGTLALGNVVSVVPTGVNVGTDNSANGIEVVCTVTVEVVPLDGGDSYQASVVHAIPRINLPGIQTPGASVAVRVDPADPKHIELDLAHEVPAAPIVLVSDDGTKQAVTVNTAPVSAADILSKGEKCTIEVLAVFPLGQNDQKGRPATGLVLTVHRNGADPYEAQIGTFVPPEAVDKVVVGATLPARYLPTPNQQEGVNLVTPDWAAI